jgi:osmoprotectant transport system permease protein
VIPLVTLAAAIGLALVAPARAQGPSRPFTVGSKAFPESWILGEAVAALARERGPAAVEHRRNLGGTEIVYEALRGGSIDVYPEYTGTIAEVILETPGRTDLASMRRALAARGIGIGEPLGFSDSYALAVTRARQQALGLRTLSDLAAHPELRMGLTHEFIGRADGWPGLARHYGLRMNDVRGIQHELAYQAIASGKIDVMDIYTTDAQIEKLGLVTLEDDRRFFPRYDAVLLYRLDLPARFPGALESVSRLEGAIDERRMIRANAMVVLDRRPVEEAADSLLAAVPLGRAKASRAGGGEPVAAGIARNTVQHLRLVGFSLLLAILIGVPLGVLAARAPLLATLTLSGAGLLQTIPSLALLAILIPLVGIGIVPALIALFLYSLLPIVRNTYVGLTTIPAPLVEASRALGLSPRAHFFRVLLPMASPAIMAGIKTSAVINVGTATLAALIGAGGLGDPILSGIQLKDHGLILQGAIPAALLALAVQGMVRPARPCRGAAGPEALETPPDSRPLSSAPPPDLPIDPTSADHSRRVRQGPESRARIPGIHASRSGAAVTRSRRRARRPARRSVARRKDPACRVT